MGHRADHRQSLPCGVRVRGRAVHLRSGIGQPALGLPRLRPGREPGYRELPVGGAQSRHRNKCGRGSLRRLRRWSLWLPTPNGELINTNSGRCLADPGNGPAGTKLVQEDCYGQAGEVWAIN